MDAAANTLSYSVLEWPIARDQGWYPPRRVPIPNAVDAGTIEYTEAGEEFAPHFAKLKAIITDRTLWSDGAEPPSIIAVAWAQLVLQQLQYDVLVPTRVVASAEGGVAICFVKGDKYSDIECLNTGAILGVASNRRGRPVVWEIEPAASGIARASARIRQFLNAPATTQDVSKWQTSRWSLSAS